MTISKERFEQLALEVFHDFCINYVSQETLKDIAHALIKRVEEESQLMTEYGVTTNAIVLPLVGE